MIFGSSAFWTLIDNAGELNLVKINRPNSLRSVPYQTDRIVDGATLAYRVRRVVDGEVMDLHTNFADLLDDLKQRAPSAEG